MADQSGDRRQEFLRRIDARRADIDEYLDKARPRGGRLTTIAIVSSAVAAALTAGPALGGEGFSNGVANGLGLSHDSLVWRLLCLFALIASVSAAIATNLGRSQDNERKIAAAESSNAGLEGLSTLLAFGQISVSEAAKQYQQAVEKIPFVDGHPIPATFTAAPVARGPAGPPPGWSGPPS